MKEFKPENIKCKCGWEWVTEKNDSHPYLCHECGFDNKTKEYNFKALNDWKMSQKPYSEERNENVIRRTFSKSVNESELTWHRDKADRVIIVLNESDWYLQFDNELPKKLNLDEEHFIPKNTFHRVIKGDTDLMVEIIETEFEEDEYEIYEIIEEGRKKKKKKKKDACYYKVRSRYDVWPSAYGSGALVKCRKVGAKNWGNKTDESVNEAVTSAEPKKDTILKKLSDSFSNVFKGKETTEILNKIKTIEKFDDFTLKASKATEGANGFDIKIYDTKNNNKLVGVLAGIMYKSDKTGLYNLQIRKAGITPEYRGKGIMRTFYEQFNEWLKKNINSKEDGNVVNKYGKFTSDFHFLYDQVKGKKIKQLVKDLEELKATITPEETVTNPTLLQKFKTVIKRKKIKPTLTPEEIKKTEEEIKRREEEIKGLSRSAYDGFSMWEDLVAKGKARRLGPDSNYIPPIIPKNGRFWALETGYALNEEVNEDKLEIYEAKKTDYSKEKKEGLHGWFSRQGGKGKSKGWVDCNTCRKDSETGRKKCKSCGRKEGEKRAKYPACRPTPASCGTKGKGKKWGKKTVKENNQNDINITESIWNINPKVLKN